MGSDEPEPSRCAPRAIWPGEVVTDPPGKAPLLAIHAFIVPDSAPRTARMCVGLRESRPSRLVLRALAAVDLIPGCGQRVARVDGPRFEARGREESGD